MLFFLEEEFFFRRQAKSERPFFRRFLNLLHNHKPICKARKWVVFPEKEAIHWSERRAPAQMCRKASSTPRFHHHSRPVGLEGDAFHQGWKKMIAG